ncbi:hypothetical protein AEP_00547 [Curvibacter sp. AEP1-3]|uniref:hypothetical protein n=1 Tax=Curvibacter sp. AEP1-3 TaxID=1844971 RepID=UPI000B3D10E4|nr:hypothetical protein [Curvibacter sp. AEP1-3]ARV17507.1 hypothetical protein AEP_00547 [Curvibacter sp. AEP1-3]
MRITAKPAEMLVIDDLPRLDPIRVVLENFEPGKGRIIIVCYDAAWVAYWGAMSGKSVQDFFVRSDAGYLASNLMSASTLSRAKNHETYLVRIVAAVQEALRERERQGGAA